MYKQPGQRPRPRPRGTSRPTATSSERRWNRPRRRGRPGSKHTHLDDDEAAVLDDWRLVGWRPRSDGGRDKGGAAATPRRCQRNGPAREPGPATRASAAAALAALYGWTADPEASRSRDSNRTGPRALTVAVHEIPRTSAILPNPSPGPWVSTCSPPMERFHCALLDEVRRSPASPSRTTASPSAAPSCVKPGRKPLERRLREVGRRSVRRAIAPGGSGARVPGGRTRRAPATSAQRMRATERRRRPAAGNADCLSHDRRASSPRRSCRAGSPRGPRGPIGAPARARRARSGSPRTRRRGASATPMAEPAPATHENERRPSADDGEWHPPRAPVPTRKRAG